MTVPPSADTGYEGVRFQAVRFELPMNLRSGRRLVSIDVVRVGELAGEKARSFRFGGFYGKLNASYEATLIVADRMELRSEGTEEVHAFAAHPVRHEDRDGVPERDT